MFCGKAANDNIDRVHKWALRILLYDHESTFEALLAKNRETNIHTQNLRMLMSEIYKTLKNTNQPFLQEYFIRKDVKYDLRTRDLLKSPAAKSIKFGIDSIKFRGSLCATAAIFKRNIKNWSGEECHCKICRKCLLILYLVIYSSFIGNCWSELARISAMYSKGKHQLTING